MVGSILSHEKSASLSLRAAIYARVSTVNNRQDPTMQTRELREYGERRGWNVVAEYVIWGFRDRRTVVPSWINSWPMQGGVDLKWSPYGGLIASPEASDTFCALLMNFRRFGLISSR